MEDTKAVSTGPGLVQRFRQDFLASIVVFLVALPLCMGIAIASGVPGERAAVVGIITGIVGGIVVGLLAGCPLQVSGPAAGLAVIVGQLIAEHGFATLGLIIMVAGVVQLLAGILRLGQWFRAVSPAVIQGMLAGIGVLIFAAQFHVMVDDKPPGSGIKFGGVINLWTIPEAVWKGLTEEVHQTAALMGFLTILAIVAWASFCPKKLKAFPAPLFGVVLATMVASMLNLQPKYPQETGTLVKPKMAQKLALSLEQKKQIRQILKSTKAKKNQMIEDLKEQPRDTLEKELGELAEASLAKALLILNPDQREQWEAMHVPGPWRTAFIDVPDELTDAVRLPTWVDFKRLLDWSILLAGLALAFVASAESLLTATAADAMQEHAPRTKYGRELAAQGIGNILCGFLGTIPMTGVIVRTGANIQAGARTRAATIMHGLWLLLFAAFFPQVLRLIPVASLAAILVYTGYKLVSPKAIKVLLQYGKGEVAIYAATLATVVIVDLLTGILVGIGLAVAKLVYTFAHLRIRLQEENGRTVLYLQGAATFIRLPKLAGALENVRPNTELHVHFEELTYIDHACLDLLMNWEKQHQATGGRLVIDWESLAGRFYHFGRANKRPSEAASNGEIIDSNGKHAPQLPAKQGPSKP